MKLLTRSIAILASLCLAACGSASEAPATPTSLPTQPVSVSSQPAKPAQTAAPVTLPADSSLEVHYIDVGQADSALILCDGHAMLIDGGNVADSDLVYAYLKKLGVNQLDFVVATHAHEDHVGGLAGALNYAKADVALCPVTNHDSKAFNNFVKYLGDTAITVPKPGDAYTLGSASFTVLGPINPSNDPNNTSIVLKLVYGDTSFLFTGDCERDEEQDILGTKPDLRATVLKVGHHGSDTSTSYPFLREIMPQFAVISCGVGNSYGHPTEDALSRLRDADVKTYRTDMQGTIICKSDGKAVSFAVERNADIDTLDLATADGHYGQANKPASSKPAATIDRNSSSVADTPNISASYVLNTNTKKFHYPSCSSAESIKAGNRQDFSGTRDEVIAMGYDPCGRCKP